MFQPQLPQRWLDAFQGIGFGTITKILLVFEKPFWNDHCKGSLILEILKKMLKIIKYLKKLIKRIKYLKKMIRIIKYLK